MTHDRVHPLKYEEATHGGSTDIYATEVDPAHDYLACAGIAIGDSDNHRIETSDNEIAFYDPVSGAKKLSDLTGGASSTKVERNVQFENERLGAVEIDGVTNAVDTNISLYAVPSNNVAIDCYVTIVNRNNAVSSIRMAHVDGAIGSVANEDYILYDAPFLPYETKTLFIPGMIASDSILVRSDSVDVNFKIYGDERGATSNAKRLAAYNVASADTDLSALLTTAKIAELFYYICNRNVSSSVTIRTALIDSNSVGNLADEDYDLYEETITSLETRGYSLGNGLDNDQTFMIRSSQTNVNVVIYGFEKISEETADLVEVKNDGYSILGTDTTKTFTNNGKTAAVNLNITLSLPVGTYFTLVKVADYDFGVTAATGEYIMDSISGGYIKNTTSGQAGSSITLKKVSSTLWAVVASGLGTWVTETV